MQNCKSFRTNIISFCFLSMLVAIPGISAGQERESDRAFDFALKLYEEDLHSLASRELKAFQARFPSHPQADKALMLAARTDLEMEQFQPAFETLRNLEISYPQSPLLPEARFLLAQSKEKQKAYLEAAYLYRRVFESHPDSEMALDALLSAGRLFRASGQSGQALSAFKDLILNYPDTPARIDAHLEIVRTYRDEGKLQHALREIDAILSVFGSDLKDPRVQTTRGEIFLSLGQYEAATQALTSATEIKGDHDVSMAFYALSRVQTIKRKFLEAIENLTKVISKSTDPALRINALSDRAALYERTDNYKAALDDYRDAIESLPDDDARELQLKYAGALVHNSEIEAAEEVLNTLRKRIETLSPEFGFEVLMSLADVNIKLERYQLAIRLLRELKSRLVEGPLYQEALWKEASVFSAYLDDCDTAVRLYKEVVQFRNSEDIDQAQLEIARCFEKAKDWPRALQAYEKYKELFPAGDHIALVRSRIDLIAATRRLGKTDPMAEIPKLIGLASSSADPEERKVLLGKAYLDMKEFEASLEQFEALSGDARNHNVIPISKGYIGQAKSFLLEGMPEPAMRTFATAESLLRQVLQAAGTGPGFEEAFELQADIVRLYPDTVGQQRHRELLQLAPQSGRLSTVSQVKVELASSLCRGAASESSGLSEARTLLQEALAEPTDETDISHGLFLLAGIHERMGQDSLAILRYRQLLRQSVDRDVVAGMVHLARLLKDNGEAEQAINLLTDVRLTFYYSNLAKVASRMLADIYFSQGLLDSAAVIYDELTVTSPGKSTNGRLVEDDLLFRKALILERAGKLTEALDGYLAFIEQAESSPIVDDAKHAVARIALVLNNRKLAMDYYELLARDASIASSRAVAHKKLGELLFDDGRYSDARAHFGAAAISFDDEIDKRSAAAGAIRCAIKLRQFDLAENEIKSFKKKYENTKEEEGQFLFDRGNEYLTMKDFKEAEKIFKGLRDDFKKSELGAKGEFGLGKVYMITNHTEESLKILTELPDRYPDSETAVLSYYNLGDFYHKSQQVQNAIHAFRMAVDHPKAGPLRERCLLYLIQCFRDVKMWEQAVNAIHLYLEEYPNTLYTFDRRVDLGVALLGLKEYDRAIALFRELLVYAKPESEAEIQFNIAECYKQQGDLHRASTEYLKVRFLTAQSKLPWHVTALFEASECLAQLREYEQARDILQRIVKEEGSESNFGRFALKKLDLLASK